MKVEIVSKIGKSNALDSQLYGFLSDFNNIAQMLPPEYKDKMQCTTDTCTIEAQKGVAIDLLIIEKEAHKLIKLGAQAGKEFYIWIQLKQAAPYDTRIRITLKAEMNLVMKTLSKKKMQQFVDGFVDGLCQIPPGVLQQFAY